MLIARTVSHNTEITLNIYLTLLFNRACTSPPLFWIKVAQWHYGSSTSTAQSDWLKALNLHVEIYKMCWSAYLESEQIWKRHFRLPWSSGYHFHNSRFSKGSSHSPHEKDYLLLLEYKHFTTITALYDINFA